MPRPTLPNELKDIGMMEVLLTHHTEENLWDFYKNKGELVEEVTDTIRKAKDRWLEKVFDRNPYNDHNWRKGRPARLDKSNWMKYLTEEDTEKYHSLRYLMKDLHICNKVFNWAETKPEFDDIKWSTERLFTMSSDTMEFELYENLRYNQAKEKWEEEDKEWIEEQKVITYHKTHHRPKGWKEEHWDKMDEFERNWHIRGGYDLEYHEECKYCVKEQEDKERRERELIEYEEREAKRIEEADRKWREQREAERRAKEEERARIPVVTYHCDVCNYTTQSSYLWDEHTDSRPHKTMKNMKDWYCKECEIQCRNLGDWTAHLQTKKHKYNVGEMKKQTEYHCEKCNYTTGHRQNFDKHLTTKAHLEKV